MGGWRKISIFLVLFVAFIFSFFRLLFFLFYLKGTSPLAFLDGIRFDFFAILPFWVLPLFILNFPFKLPKALYLVSLWYIYITILVFVAILIFDFIFFGQTQNTYQWKSLQFRQIGTSFSKAYYLNGNTL